MLATCGWGGIPRSGLKSALSQTTEGKGDRGDPITLCFAPASSWSAGPPRGCLGPQPLSLTHIDTDPTIGLGKSRVAPRDRLTCTAAPGAGGEQDAQRTKMTAPWPGLGGGEPRQRVLLSRPLSPRPPRNAMAGGGSRGDAERRAVLRRLARGHAPRGLDHGTGAAAEPASCPHGRLRRRRCRMHVGVCMSCLVRPPGEGEAARLRWQVPACRCVHAYILPAGGRRRGKREGRGAWAS